MADSPRIEDLRRRVQKDPASIAFAQLAEECRRAEQYQEAVDTCRAGLALHPGYLSARVTLGRALIELDQLDEAQAELEIVLASAAENLAAIRGLAEIYHRRGSLADALRQYRTALALARNDPDLERTVTELSRAIEPKPPAPVFDGLSFEDMASEFMKHSPPPAAPVAPPLDVSLASPEAVSTNEVSDTVPDTVSDTVPDTIPDGTGPAPTSVSESAADLQGDLPALAAEVPPSPLSNTETASAGQVPPTEMTGADLPAEDATGTQASHAEAESGVAERRRAQATIAELDQWLDAIHVARAQRRA